MNIRSQSLRLSLLTLLVLLLSTARGQADTWTPETLPMPYLADSTRYTCNPDGILSAKAVAKLDSICGALERAKGVQCIVVVVEHLKGDDPFDFNRALFSKYGIGQKGRDNGLVITLATLDRSYFISPGRGLEGTLPDAICKRIENALMVPLLKEGAWDEAMMLCTLACAQYIEGDDTLLKQAEEDADAGDTAALLVGLLTVAGVIGGASYAAYRESHRRCPHCGAKYGMTLTRARSLYSSSRSPIETRHELWTCRKCGHQEQRTRRINHALSEGGMGGGVIGAGGFGRGGGGGFSGGSFGGGSYGGGGAGGRF